MLSNRYHVKKLSQYLKYIQSGIKKPLLNESDNEKIYQNKISKIEEFFENL